MAKRKTSVKYTKIQLIQNILRKILKSLIMSIDFKSWNYCIPCRHGLLGHTTKQSLRNFEPKKPWKYKQVWGLRPDPGYL